MVLLVFCTTISFCTAKPIPQGSTCSSQGNFIMVDSNGTVQDCWPCPECPLGQGLPYQCGSTLPWDTIIECKPCEAKKSYSDTHDISTCKPCQECDGVTGMLKECTLEQNRVCVSKCPKGYFKHQITDSCQECFFCCESATEDERLQQCKDIGMPTDKQCEKTLKNEQCKNNSTMIPTIIPTTPTPPTPTPPATPTPTPPATPTPTPPATPPATPTSLNPPKKTNNKQNSSPQLDHNNDVPPKETKSLILCATIIPGTFIIIAFLVHRIWKKYKGISSTSATDSENNKPSSLRNAEVGDEFNRLRTRQLTRTSNISYSVVPDTDEGSANTSQESLDVPLNDSFKPDGSSIPEDTPVSVILEMGELLDQLKGLDYEEKLTKKNWRSVGRALKVSKKKLDGIQRDYQSSSPTEGLLEYLATLGQKQPTVKMLFVALLTCERYDLAECLCTCSWQRTSSV